MRCLRFHRFGRGAVWSLGLVFDALDSCEVGVLDEGLREVDFVDVGEGGEPSEDIGELFFEVVAFSLGGGFVFAVVVGEGGGEFPELFGEVEEGSCGTSGVVGGEISIADELLELEDGDPGGVDLGAWGGIWGHDRELWG